jgi:Zn finger protein HypA/HybF involved in hydrogenase expression
MLTLYCNDCGETHHVASDYAYCCPHCYSVHTIVVNETKG